jgi:hypothetical protein
MEILNTIANFQIIKTIFFIILTIVIIIALIIINIKIKNKKYLSTNDCEIKSNNDGSFTQIINYNVNNKNYTKNIDPKITSNTDPVTKVVTNNKGFKYPEYTKGNCLLYYESTNPDNYNVDSDPSVVFKIIFNIIFIFVITGSICALLWFIISLIFYNYNKNATGVMGAVNILNNI